MIDTDKGANVVNGVPPGSWPPDDLRRAFAAGAKWWEWRNTSGTMWPSDRDRVEAEAEQRYPGGQLPGVPPAPDPEKAELVAALKRLLCHVGNHGLPQAALEQDAEYARTLLRRIEGGGE